MGTDTLKKVPNKWWVRLLFVRGLSYVVIATVFLQVVFSVGWRNPFSPSVTGYGLPAMPGWVFDLAFARSTNAPNSAHLVSYIGIPIIGLYAMWKFRDEFMGPLMGAFLVAVHEGIWEAFYYLGYYQYLSWALLTNVLKDVSFASMIALFILAFWKYPDRKISMWAFALPALVYFAFVWGWFFLAPIVSNGTYPFLPIALINNYIYGHGVYSETAFYGDFWVELTEVVGWFGLFLMFQAALMLRGKPA